MGPYLIDDKTFEHSYAFLAIDHALTHVWAVQPFKPLLLHLGLCPVGMQMEEPLRVDVKWNKVRPDTFLDASRVRE